MIEGDSFLQSEQEVNYFLQVDWRLLAKPESVGFFLILVLFYDIMSRHIKGSNEHLYCFLFLLIFRRFYRG